MNELEEWFLEEFGRLGFDLTPMMYSPESFMPARRVIYQGEVVPYVQITPEAARDLSWHYPTLDVVEEYRNLIREALLRFLEERKDKDFKPIRKLNKFKL